jgi:hypothetical protein
MPGITDRTRDAPQKHIHQPLTLALPVALNLQEKVMRRGEKARLLQKTEFFNNRLSFI